MDDTTSQLVNPMPAPQAAPSAPASPVGAVPDPAATGGMDAASGTARPVNSPTDTSLATVLGELDRAGWGGQFVPLEGGDIRCVTCRRTFPAAEAHADEARRLEGVSDPADMVIVVRLACPHCSTRGVLVAHYGPEASVEEADVVAAMSRTPATGQGTEYPPGTTA